MIKNARVSKDQDISRPEAHLAETAEAFNTAVAQCADDVDPDAVHRLRTGSRRLEALLEATLRENPGVDLQESAQAWLRQLKRIRRAAGPVRDLDVHRKLLEDWIGKDPANSEEEKLDAWLKHERKRLAHHVQKQSRKKQLGLAERQAEFLSALDQKPLKRKPRPVDSAALEAFMRAADSMPWLDAENLHDFRKATKKARYLAESGPAADVAKALKRIQDAIGDWHDWLCLAQEAKSALGDSAPELTWAFDQEVDRHFAAAMKTTQTIRARLTGEWMGRTSKRPKPAISTALKRAG